MLINDNEILHNIIEIQGCIIQGRSIKALLHRNINFYLEKCEADIITIYIHEHEEMHIECILEEHRNFAHLVKKYISGKKKLDWKSFVKNCAKYFAQDATYYKFNSIKEILKDLIGEKDSSSLSNELQMKEAVMMPIYAFDLKEKIGYICFMYLKETDVEIQKLENVRILFQTLLQPLYDSDHNMIFSKCARIDDNMRLLTDQEKRIARKVLGGYSYPQISEDLGISINTLKTHMKNIFNKYNVTSKMELYNTLNSSL